MTHFFGITEYRGFVVKPTVFFAAAWMAILLGEPHGFAGDSQGPVVEAGSRQPSPSAPPASERLLPDDPLYRAILEELRSGRQPLATPRPSQDAARLESDQSVSATGKAAKGLNRDQDWRAIELMLKAARLLDRETVLQANAAAPETIAKRRAWGMALRRQVEQILQESASESSR